MGWTTLATAVNVAAQLVFVAVLARALPPADFGLMAMAALALRFASFFAQAGAAQTLVQVPTLTPAVCTAALAVALGVSGLLALVLLAATPLAVAWFQAPALGPVLQAMVLSLPLSATGALPLALLRRAGRFKAASCVEVAAYVLAYGPTGCLLASQGAGVWALVVASLAQQALLLIAGSALARPALGGPIPRTLWRPLLGQGMRYSMIGFLEFLWANIETLLIGRRLGGTSLGVYNRGQLLATLPAEQAVGSAGKVLFPAFSRLQHDRAALADGFVLLLLALCALSGVLAAGLAAAADDVVQVMLGPHWQQAVPVVVALCAAVPAQFGHLACGVTLDSLAALDPKLRLQAALLAVKLLALVLAAPLGMGPLLLTIVACEWLRLLLTLRLLARMLTLASVTLLHTLALAALPGLAVGTAVLAMAQATAGPHWAAGLRLAVEVLAGAGALLIGLWPLARIAVRFAPLQRCAPLQPFLARWQAASPMPSSR